MYKLLPVNYIGENETQQMLALATLQKFALIVPFTIADARNELETGQIQPFSDDAFYKLIFKCWSLPIDESFLTAQERAVLNVMRDFLQPDPSKDCCGSDPLASVLITYSANPIPSDPNYRNELRVTLEPNATCALAEIEATLVPVGPAPAPTVNPVTLYTIGCVNGDWVFSYLWLEFGSDPSGQDYLITYVYKDESGATLFTDNSVPITLP